MRWKLPRRAYLDEIDALGGAIAAIDAGYQQRQIQDAAYRVQREIERAERVVVGVNKFTDDEVVTPALQRIDPSLEREQVERLVRSVARATWRPGRPRWSGLRPSRAAATTSCRP